MNEKNEKIIGDIRLYKSDVSNVDGNSLPSPIDNKALHVIIHRIVMKLREKGFSLGEFDHLYLNFTVCLDNDVIAPAKRSRDTYSPWYRYYDVGVDDLLYKTLDREQSIDRVVVLLERTLLKYFANGEKTQEIVASSIREAISQKENMLMQYKIKETANRKVILYLRYLDSARYFPLLCVYDLKGNELLRKDLEVSMDLSSFGTIQLSNKKVTIKPKAKAICLKPISYEF